LTYVHIRLLLFLPLFRHHHHMLVQCHERLGGLLKFYQRAA
jgi:hypothetical protein